MKFPKPIIDEFVSLIDLKDVQEYVKQLDEKTIKNLFFDSSLITNKISKSNTLDFIQF